VIHYTKLSFYTGGRR